MEKIPKKLRKIERTLNYITPSRLDDVILKTRETKQVHIEELGKVFKIKKMTYSEQAAIKKTV